MISGQLQHPGVVPIHKLGTLKDGRLFIAMKLVKGQTLQQLIDGKERTPSFVRRLMDVFSQVCQTVAYAHSHAIIHRDLKPQNIMVGSFGETQVMDWGLAKQLASQNSSIDQPLDTENTAISSLDTTQFGVIMGTPAYMAPEQAAGGPVDQRVDVFSLGGILCEILTGTAPLVPAERKVLNTEEVRHELSLARDRLQQSGMERELIDLAQECLQFAPHDRPCNAQEVNHRLTRYFDRRDELLRESELEQARSQTRLQVERKRRKQVMILVRSWLPFCWHNR